MSTTHHQVSIHQVVDCTCATTRWSVDVWAVVPKNRHGGDPPVTVANLAHMAQEGRLHIRVLQDLVAIGTSDASFSIRMPEGDGMQT